MLEVEGIQLIATGPMPPKELLRGRI